MAERGWTAYVAAAAGLAAGIGSAQLGLGYGLGVVVWPVTQTVDDSVWLGSLGWATWIAASATVFGAVTASRLRSEPVSTRPSGPWRVALALGAAVGAVVTVALIALPAQAAVRSDTFSPQTVAAGHAAAGILLGLVIAYWAVASRPVAANLIATAALLWALAVAAIVVELIWHRPSATYLTSWQFAGIGTRYGAIHWPSSVLTLAAALLIGVVAAWPAVRRGDLGLGAATSGAAGPLLVAAAFFLLAPQLTGSSGSLESAFLIAPYAVLAGLAGSALTVAIGKRAAERRARRAAGSTPGGGAGVHPGMIRPGSADRAAREASRSGAPREASTAGAARETSTAGSGASRSGAKGGATTPVPRDTRSTVARPPAAPPIAKINPSAAGPATPKKAPAKQPRNSGQGNDAPGRGARA
jgi:hypothetical protein